MSDQTWRERMNALIAGNDFAGGAAYDEMQARALAVVNERLDAENMRCKVWMVMPYRCDRCGLVLWYECEVGVEGPPSWREDLTYLASPFTAGRCPRDGAALTHVMHRDIEFGVPVQSGYRFTSPFTATATQAEKFFRVPREPWPYTTEGCDDDGRVIGGVSCQPFLSTPMHAIRRKQRPVEAEPFA